MVRARAIPGVAMAGLAAVGLAAVGLGIAARIVRRVTVEGASMEPTLVPGDRLVVLPAFRLRPGDIVAVPDPRRPRRPRSLGGLRGILVKRVISVDDRNRLVSVEGDNRDQSTDSRTFGPLRRGAVVGRVVYRYAPAARVGRVDGRR